MAIRFANNCSNCKNLIEKTFCSKHEVLVSQKYTCDLFDMKAELKNERSCTNCNKHKTENCAHPSKAAVEMMCSSWAPTA